RVKRGPYSHLETPTVNNNQSAQFAGLVTGDDIRLGRRQKDCGDEHGQPDDGGNEAASEAERENHQGCSGDSQENAEEHPRARVAPQVRHFGHDQHESKERSDRSIVQQASSGKLHNAAIAGWKYCSLMLDHSGMQTIDFAEATNPSNSFVLVPSGPGS